MRADFDHCPVCLYEKATARYRSDGVDAVRVECPRCGKFELSDTLAASDFESSFGPRWLLSSALRNQYELGEPIALDTTTVGELLKTVQEPNNLFRSIDLLVQHVYHKSNGPEEGTVIEIATDFPLFYARNTDELFYYISKAESLGLIESAGTVQHYRLGLQGWKRILEMQENNANSDQAFVAMWFDPDLTTAYTDGFAPALDKCGYQPTRIDLHEHNDKIDDRIISEIRRSGLLVADFTGHRGGVYFEAGFAMGLGIPVIWTCRSDDIGEAHFDTRQYNHIVWDGPDDLKEKLINRITATVPRAP